MPVAPPSLYAGPQAAGAAICGPLAGRCYAYPQRHCSSSRVNVAQAAAVEQCQQEQLQGMLQQGRHEGTLHHPPSTSSSSSSASAWGRQPQQPRHTRLVRPLHQQRQQQQQGRQEHHQRQQQQEQHPQLQQAYHHEQQQRSEDAWQEQGQLSLPQAEQGRAPRPLAASDWQTLRHCLSLPQQQHWDLHQLQAALQLLLRPAARPSPKTSSSWQQQQFAALVVQLLQRVAAQADQASPEQLSQCLWLTAKLLPPGLIISSRSSSSSDAPSGVALSPSQAAQQGQQQGLGKQLQRCCGILAASLSLRLGRCTPKQLSLALWGVSKLGHPLPADFWQAYWPVTAPVLQQQYGPQDLANTLWAIQQQQRLAQEQGSHSASSSSSGSEGGQHHSSSSSCCGVAGACQVPAAWAAVALAAVQQQVPVADPHALCTLLLALPGCGLAPPPGWCHRVCAALQPRLQQLSWRGWASALGAMAQLGHPPEPLWMDALAAAAQSAAAAAAAAAHSAVQESSADLAPPAAAAAGGRMGPSLKDVSQLCWAAAAVADQGGRVPWGLQEVMWVHVRALCGRLMVNTRSYNSSSSRSGSVDGRVFVHSHQEQPPGGLSDLVLALWGLVRLQQVGGAGSPLGGDGSGNHAGPHPHQRHQAGRHQQQQQQQEQQQQIVEPQSESQQLQQQGRGRQPRQQHVRVLLRGCLPALQPHVGALSGQDLALLLWTVAMAGLSSSSSSSSRMGAAAQQQIGGSSGWVADVLAALQQRLPHMDPHSRALALAACVHLQVPVTWQTLLPMYTTAAAAMGGQQQQDAHQQQQQQQQPPAALPGTARDLVMAGYSLARLQQRPLQPWLCAWLAGLQPALANGSVPPEQLAPLAWTLVQRCWGLTPGRLQQLHPGWVSSYCQAVGQQAPAMSASQLGAVFAAGGLLGLLLQQQQQLLGELVAAAQVQLQVANHAQLLRLLRPCLALLRNAVASTPPAYAAAEEDAVPGVDPGAAPSDTAAAAAAATSGGEDNGKEDGCAVVVHQLQQLCLQGLQQLGAASASNSRHQQQALALAAEAWPLLAGVQGAQEAVQQLVQQVQLSSWGVDAQAPGLLDKQEQQQSQQQQASECSTSFTDTCGLLKAASRLHAALSSSAAASSPAAEAVGALCTQLQQAAAQQLPGATLQQVADFWAAAAAGASSSSESSAPSEVVMAAAVCSLQQHLKQLQLLVAQQTELVAGMAAASGSGMSVSMHVSSGAARAGQVGLSGGIHASPSIEGLARPAEAAAGEGGETGEQLDDLGTTMTHSIITTSSRSSIASAATYSNGTAQEVPEQQHDAVVHLQQRSASLSSLRPRLLRPARAAAEASSSSSSSLWPPNARPILAMHAAAQVGAADGVEALTGSRSSSSSHGGSGSGAARGVSTADAIQLACVVASAGRLHYMLPRATLQQLVALVAPRLPDLPQQQLLGVLQALVSLQIGHLVTKGFSQRLWAALACTLHQEAPSAQVLVALVRQVVAVWQQKRRGVPSAPTRQLLAQLCWRVPQRWAECSLQQQVALLRGLVTLQQLIPAATLRRLMWAILQQYTAAGPGAAAAAGSTTSSSSSRRVVPRPVQQQLWALWAAVRSKQQWGSGAGPAGDAATLQHAQQQRQQQGLQEHVQSQQQQPATQPLHPGVQLGRERQQQPQHEQLVSCTPSVVPFYAAGPALHGPPVAMEAGCVEQPCLLAAAQGQELVAEPPAPPAVIAGPGAARLQQTHRV